MFGFIYPLIPLFPGVAVALWSGILFKSYDSDPHGRVREISARCLGLFLPSPLLGLYLLQLWLLTFGSRPAFPLEAVLKTALIVSLVLLAVGLGLWLHLRLKGRDVESGQQSVDGFLLKSWRLTAICSATATMCVLLVPAILSRFY